MKGLALGTRRQAILFGSLAVLLLFFVVRWSAREKPPGSPTAPVVPSIEEPEARGARSRQRAATPGPDEIPMLRPIDLQPRRRSAAVETERNLFDPREPTKPPPPPPTPAPTVPPMVGPLPPPPPPPTPLPVEPTFKLIGIIGPKDRPIAVLEYGGDTINVQEGETVLSRWIIRKVGYESIDVGFIGYPAESRRLPITQ